MGQTTENGSITPGDNFPSAILQTAKPPLVVGVFLIQIPCVWPLLDGRMEVAQEFGDLHVFFTCIFGRDVRPRFAERIQPFEVLPVVGLIPGVADAVEFAVARKGRKLVPDHKNCGIPLLLRVKRTGAEVDRDLRRVSGSGPFLHAGGEDEDEEQEQAAQESCELFSEHVVSLFSPRSRKKPRADYCACRDKRRFIFSSRLPDGLRRPAIPPEANAGDTL